MPEHLVGRETELARLDTAWATRETNVFTYVALGGEGKTSLVAKWAATLAGNGWQGCDAAFAWSFYSQGTRDQGDASADVFLAEALRFFGDTEMADSAASAWDKGRRVAQLIGEQRALLILDGLEPLQYSPTSPTKGELKENGIVALLSGLAAKNAGLCIVTTRYSIPNLNTYKETTAPEIELERLSKQAGVHLLKTLGVRKESGTQNEFDDLVEDVKGHALTINLMGTFLADAHGGDVRKRALVKLRKADAKIQGGHAFRVMDAYVRWLDPQPRWWQRLLLKFGLGRPPEERPEGRKAMALLRLMGLFDRAASADCIAALQEPPVIKKLTEPLVGLSEAQRNIALKRLEETRLITVDRDDAGTLLALDCHPLIREYFAQRLQDEQEDAWRAGHKRLYEHLCTTTKEGDEPTLEQLQPLYQAVTHGCLAGLQQEVSEDVYDCRILKGTASDGFYSTRKLGAFGADLGAVACFFDEPWTRVSDSLSEDDQAWLLHQSAFRLHALGRLREALAPMRATLKISVEHEQWVHAAAAANNLCEVSLTLGQLGEAVKIAEQALDYAERSGDAFHRTTKRTRLADALHQAGHLDDAQTWFAEAEVIQAERQSEYPRLYSVQGFLYCDLLLTPWHRLAWRAPFPTTVLSPTPDPATTLEDIEQRATQILAWDKPFGRLIDGDSTISHWRASCSIAAGWRVSPFPLRRTSSLTSPGPWTASARRGSSNSSPPVCSRWRGIATTTGTNQVRGKRWTKRRISPHAGRCRCTWPTSICTARGCLVIWVSLPKRGRSSKSTATTDGWGNLKMRRRH